jgi:hypothetical protein
MGVEPQSRRPPLEPDKTPGFLRLTSAPAPNLVSARNTLTQVLQSEHSIVTARLDASGLADGQRAGLAMFGQGISWIGVARKDGVSRVTFSSAGVDTPGPDPDRQGPGPAGRGRRPGRALQLQPRRRQDLRRPGRARPAALQLVERRPPGPVHLWRSSPSRDKGVADFDWVTVKPVTP